jgi:hypothetical protein
MQLILVWLVLGLLALGLLAIPVLFFTVWRGTRRAKRNESGTDDDHR